MLDSSSPTSVRSPGWWVVSMMWVSDSRHRPQPLPSRPDETGNAINAAAADPWTGLLRFHVTNG